MLKTITLSILLLVAVSSVAQAKLDGVAEKPFAEGGQIRMELGVGDYDILSGNSDRIQIEWVTGTSSRGGGTPAEIEVNGSKAHITTTDTTSHFHATIKVPTSADLEIHQNGGGLRIGAVKGNKDLESTTGHIVVQIVSADHTETSMLRWAWAICSLFVRAGEEGSGKSVKWAGSGKYRLHVRLGERDIILVPADTI